MEEDFRSLRDAIRKMMGHGYNSETMLILASEFCREYLFEQEGVSQYFDCTAGCQVACQSVQQTSFYLQDLLEKTKRESEVKGER